MTENIAWSEAPVFDYPAYQENLPAWSRDWHPETDSPPTAPIVSAPPRVSDLNMAWLIVGILAMLGLGTLMFVGLVMAQ